MTLNGKGPVLAAIRAGIILAVSMMPAVLSAKADEAPPLFAPKTQSFFLENGLQVVVIPDHRAPVVTHMIWYRAGAADEKPGVSGVAHFLEHLLFKGTTKYPDGAFSKKIAEIGGQDNAFTSQDYTAYFQRVAKEHLGLVMELEADRMRNLVLDPDDITTERSVILEERRQRIDNNPGSILSESLTAAFYKSHPYGTPIIGWQHEMETLDRKALLDFYRTFYAPENAILIVAGDVLVDEVKTLAETNYGAIAQDSGRIDRARPQEPPHLAERRIILRDDRVRQPSMQQAYLVPSYATAAPGEAEALDILSEILGGGPTSRIYQALVVNQKIAAGAGAWYQGTALDDSRFGLYATPADGTGLEDVETALEAVVADLIETGVTQEEVERTRNALLASAIYAQDSQVGLARAFGTGLTSGETIEDIQEWPRRIMAVTPDDVQAVARRYLKPDFSATGYLLPADKEPRS